MTIDEVFRMKSKSDVKHDISYNFRILFFPFPLTDSFIELGACCMGDKLNACRGYLFEMVALGRAFFRL